MNLRDHVLGFRMVASLCKVYALTKYCGGFKRSELGKDALISFEPAKSLSRQCGLGGRPHPHSFRVKEVECIGRDGESHTAARFVSVRTFDNRDARPFCAMIEIEEGILPEGLDETDIAFEGGAISRSDGGNL